MLVHYAGWRLAISVAGGVAAGAALAALMRLIHRALTLPSAATGGAALQFVLLLAVYFVGNVSAQHALSDAAARTMLEGYVTQLKDALKKGVKS